MPPPEGDAPERIPVLMLSGFLGAGKTTLLRHILTNNEGFKIGCIVNDVAAINVDAKLVKKTDLRQDEGAQRSTADLADTLELQNGCACCSIQDELLDSFRQLVRLGKQRGEPFQWLVLENSGVAEPQNIRDVFQEAQDNGDPLMREVELATMVTVVDAGNFQRDFASKAPLVSRPDLGDGGNFRPVVDLLVEQIECSDTILINKIDLVKGDKALASLRAIVSSFNPMAECLAVEQGRCPMHVLFDRKRPALMAGLTSEGQHKGAVAAARAADVGGACDHAHGGEGPCTTCDARRGRGGATTAAVRFGITSFVYERRRPFHPQRLRRTVLRWLPSTAALKPSAGDAAEDAAQGQPGDSPLQRVLRSKGFCWMSNSHSKAYFWSHAGQHFEMRDEGDWWASVPEAEWPADAAGRLSIARDFDLAAYAPDGGARADVALPPGDRRQEVVFIGAGMDEAAIASALDECLLTDDELALYHENWGRLRDPGGESVRAAVAQAIAQKQAAQS